MKKVFIALIACLCIVAMNVVSVSAFASELPIIQKLLVIIDDELSSSIPQYNTNDYIEFVDVDDFNEAYDNYISYAVSVEDSTLDNINQILRNAYEEFDAKIYIYGGLTISNYKEILAINDLYINMNASNNLGNIVDTVEMRFDNEQKKKKKEAIIAITRNSNSQSLTVTGESLAKEDCVSIIIEHFNSTFVSKINREASIVYSSYGHRVYSSRYGSAYINVDYILYKDQSESDPVYDYYALKTNVTGTQTNPDTQIGRVSFNGIQVKHKLVNSSDNITDYAPKDVNRANNVSVGLNLGTGGTSIGINFGSGAGPTIDSSYDPNAKEVSWKVSRYWFFGRPFSGDMFSFATSFTTKGKISVDVSTYATFSVVNNNAFAIDWDTQRVTFG